MLEIDKHVIFLIESERVEKEMLINLLEKDEYVAVYSFFCIEEALLYTKLKPNLVVYDSPQPLDLTMLAAFGQHVDALNLTSALAYNDRLKLQSSHVSYKLAQGIIKRLSVA